MSGAATVLRRYRDVIAPARGPVAGYFLNGVAVSLKPLAAVFLLREHGHAFDLVGLVLAAEVLGTAISMPLQGKAIDRHGPARVLVPLGVAHLAAMILFVLAVGDDAGAAMIVGLTFIWGLTQPVILPSLRALWGTLFSDAQRDTAYAVQAVLTEFVFISGPLMAALFTLVGSAGIAMIAAAAMSLLGAVVFAATAQRRPVDPTAEPPARRWLPALANPQLRLLLGVGALGGVTSGGVEILLPVFAETGGATEWAGVAFAALAAGSVVGGLVYGARGWNGPLPRRYAALSALLGLMLLPLVITPVFAVVCVVVFIAGLALAPGEACLYGLIDDAASDATVVEANSWLTAAHTAGLGLGAAAGGWLVESTSISAAAIVPAAGALLAAVVIISGVRHTPAPQAPAAAA